MLDSCDRRGDEADRYEASKRRSAVRRTTKVSGRWRRPSWSRNRTVACGPATGRVREPQSATARCGTAGLARGLGAWKTCATRRRMRWIEAIRRCERQRQRSPHDGLRPIAVRRPRSAKRFLKAQGQWHPADWLCHQQPPSAHGCRSWWSTPHSVQGVPTPCEYQCRSEVNASRTNGVGCGPTRIWQCRPGPLPS